MRINQYLASTTTLSRRGADEAIRAGQVTIDGRAASIGETISKGADVRYQGERVEPAPQRRTIALNKPVGVICSRRRQGTAPTIYQLIPPELAQLNPAGRLDQDSSGLVIMTNNGNLLQRLSHPSNDKLKIYQLTLDRAISAADLAKLGGGVELADGPSRIQIMKHSGRHLVVGLGEGRNRQIRRTLGAVGYEVRELHRTQIGPIELGDLAPGAWRAIEPAELP